MTKIIYIIIIIFLYSFWIIYPLEGMIPFFIIQLIVTLSLIKEYFYYKKITVKLKDQYFDKLPYKNYWDTLISYGHTIYNPHGAESVAVSFSFARVIGWIFALVLLYLGRTIEAIICFANTFLLAIISGWLDPIFFMREFSRKKPVFDIKANIINELRNFVKAVAQEELQQPNSAEDLCCQGQKLYKDRDYEKSSELFKQAILLKPDYVEVIAGLGFDYCQLGRYLEAAELFKQAIRLKPDYAEGHAGLGWVYAVTGRNGEALLSLRLALNLKPDFAEAHRELGTIYLKLGNREAAIGEWKILQSLDKIMAKELLGIINE